MKGAVKFKLPDFLETTLKLSKLFGANPLFFLFQNLFFLNKHRPSAALDWLGAQQCHLWLSGFVNKVHKNIIGTMFDNAAVSPAANCWQDKLALQAKLLAKSPDKTWSD